MRDDDLRVQDYDETKDRDVMWTPRTAVIVGIVVIVGIIIFAVIYIISIASK
jgi:hypothetical protein